LGIGDWAQSPIPNPQSPIPIEIKLYNVNYIFKLYKIKKLLKNKNLNIFLNEINKFLLLILIKLINYRAIILIF